MVRAAVSKHSLQVMRQPQLLDTVASFSVHTQQAWTVSPRTGTTASEVLPFTGTRWGHSSFFWSLISKEEEKSLPALRNLSRMYCTILSRMISSSSTRMKALRSSGCILRPTMRSNLILRSGIVRATAISQRSKTEPCRCNSWALPSRCSDDMT